jgi:hypothetical protein
MNNSEEHTKKDEPSAIDWKSMFALISKEQIDLALEARMEAPVSIRSLVALTNRILYDTNPSGTTLERTLAFIRAKRLPKAKMLAWMTKHHIFSDSDFRARICLPDFKGWLTRRPECCTETAKSLGLTDEPRPSVDEAEVVVSKAA